MNPEVLIVGAGPTGLVLALWLTKLGVKVRIIDKSSGPGETSRAVGVQARTLEFYRQMNLMKHVVSQGILVDKLTLRRNAKKVVSSHFDKMGKGLSPFPYMLSFPQDVHERVLIQHLEQVGVQVERKTELLDFKQSGNLVQAVLQNPRGRESMQAQYICGCDGAHSSVREILKMDFAGGTYQHIFYVADVIPYGAHPDGVQMCFDRKDFCLIFPVRNAESVRLIGIVPEAVEKKEDIKFDDLEADINRITGSEYESVNWFSTYHVHHRLASSFQQGQAFLLGDAAHIHSPAGAQGMNTGIGDAVNLAWKLAAVLQGRATAQILQTYESERMQFAKSLVATTDRVFRVAASRSSSGVFFRMLLVPILAPLLIHFSPVRRFIFKLISQIRIKYRESLLSVGVAGKIHGGDRLPWVPHSHGDNFDVLTENDWQLHSYGKAEAKIQLAMRESGFSLYDFPWNKSAAKAGLKKGVLYLIRPDGHVALIVKKQNVQEIKDYIQRFQLKPLQKIIREIGK